MALFDSADKGDRIRRPLGFEYTKTIGGPIIRITAATEVGRA